MAQWFTDFREYPADTALGSHSDWTQIWNTGPNAMVRAAGSEHYVHVTNPGSTARSAWRWESVGTLGSSDRTIQVHAEILFNFVSQHNEIGIHMGGSSGSETAYFATRLSTNRVVVMYSSGTSSTIASSSFTQSTGIRYHILFEVFVSAFQEAVRHKIWPATDTEPSSWLGSTTTGFAPRSGHVGIGAVNASTDYEIYHLGVGTNGDPAPREPDISPPENFLATPEGNAIRLSWDALS